MDNCIIILQMNNHYFFWHPYKKFGLFCSNCSGAIKFESRNKYTKSFKIFFLFKLDYHSKKDFRVSL